MSVTALHERRTQGSRLSLYELHEWQEAYGVLAGVTSGEGEFDLGLYGTDPAGAVLDRWSRFRDTFGSAVGGVAVSHQVHANDVALHDRSFEGLQILQGFDGHVTRLRGILVTVTVADCVPVYLVHPETGAVGMLHAGWRGTAAGILERGIARLCEVARTSAGELVMHCGVAICGECYEVGPEVHAAVLGTSVTAPARLDLRKSLVERAFGSGVREVTASGWCTAHDDGRFFSYRASGGAAGRMVAYVGRPNT